jgi:hypothetical protein
MTNGNISVDINGNLCVIRRFHHVDEETGVDNVHYICYSHGERVDNLSGIDEHLKKYQENPSIADLFG